MVELPPVRHQTAMLGHNAAIELMDAPHSPSDLVEAAITAVRPAMYADAIEWAAIQIAEQYTDHQLRDQTGGYAVAYDLTQLAKRVRGIDV